MRILTSKYWHNFKKTIVDSTGKKKVVRNGKKFEELVQKILDLEYGPNHWKPTGKSWDGSRDFEWKTSRSYKWAECKNYEKTISLNVLSNTLIMALIDFADEILIFSYSKIKKPVLKKLVQFADISQKKVKVYADESLEEIILNYLDELKSDFFPSANFTDFELKYLMPYISCQIISDPIVAYTTNADMGLIEKSPYEINFDSILCLSIFICNRSCKKIPIKIKLDWFNKDFIELTPMKQSLLDFFLEPNATIVKKIYFKALLYNPVLCLPAVSIFCNLEKKIFKFGTVKCSWVGECFLQGSSYKKILNTFETKVLNTPFFSAINLYGTSGVGKSRLLVECENIALGYGFRVIRFKTNLWHKKENNINKIIIEFICGLYDIPDIEEFFDKSLEEELSGIYKVLFLMQKQKINQNYLEDIIKMISKRLMETHCFISIDNIQYYPTPFISFINLIIENLLISNKHCKSRIAISFNTDYIYQQDKCVSLWEFLRSNKDRIVNEIITGFSTIGETKLFLNQLLHNSDTEMEHAWKIVHASNKNPFYVQAYLKWLETEQIITPQKDGYKVLPSKQEAFKEKMNSVPNDINSILEKRWEYFIENHDEIHSLKILAVVHIFTDLDDNLIKKFSLCKKQVNELYKFHFLTIHDNPETFYTFEHDLTEKFFSKKYALLCKYAFYIGEAPQDIDYIWYNMLNAIINNINRNNFPNSFILDNEPPHKIGYEIYTLWISHAVNKMDSILALENDLENITKVCAIAREAYGTDAAITLYKYIINKVNSAFTDYKANMNWAWVIISYSNLLYERNLYDEAILMIKDLLKYWPEEKISSYNVSIYAYLYNRLHVYTRAKKTQITDETLIWLEKSESMYGLECIVEKDSDEIKFINLIDRGYCNYGHCATQTLILLFWNEACTIYEKGNIPSKRMNYLYAKMQVQLFQMDLTGAQKTIREGLNAIELKEQNTYYFLYFKQRFLLCKAACLLMDKKFNKDELDELFEQIEDYNCILKSRISYSVQWLKSIHYWYQKQFVNAFICIQSALEFLYLNQKKLFEIYI